MAYINSTAGSLCRLQIRPHINLPRAGFQESNYLFIALKAVAEVYKVPGQQIVAFAHQPDKNVQEVNTVKNNGIAGYVLVYGFEEKFRMLCPVHGRLDVVTDVIAIIPALYIVLRIDAGNTVFVAIIRVGGIYKSMLRPVAHHGYEAVNEKWNDKHHQRGRPVDKAQNHAEKYKK